MHKDKKNPIHDIYSQGVKYIDSMVRPGILTYTWILYKKMVAAKEKSPITAAANFQLFNFLINLLIFFLLFKLICNFSQMVHISSLID